MNNDLASIAVVIPCCNAEKWVARAVRSVLDQAYPNLEVIVIDDGSIDGSLGVIKSFGAKIRYETGPNRGACAARNRGLALASADYVTFLDADDYVEGPIFMGVGNAIRRSHPQVIISNCTIEKGGKKEIVTPQWRQKDIGEILSDVLSDVGVQGNSLCFRRDFINEIGGWNEDALREQDVEISLRAFSFRPTHVNNYAGSAVWRIRPDSSRISARDSRETLVSVLRWHIALESRILQNNESHKVAFAKRLYNLAAEFYQFGWWEPGDEALRHSRELGLRGHIGSRRHKLVASILGLKQKTVLADKVRGIVKRRNNVVVESP